MSFQEIYGLFILFSQLYIQVFRVEVLLNSSIIVGKEPLVLETKMLNIWKPLG